MAPKIAKQVILCFGIARAHSVERPHPFFAQKTFTVYTINALKNYETHFNFFAQKTFVYGPAPKAIAFQNKLLTVNKNFECDFNKLKLSIPEGRRLKLISFKKNPGLS